MKDLNLKVKTPFRSFKVAKNDPNCFRVQLTLEDISFLLLFVTFVTFLTTFVTLVTLSFQSNSV